MKELIKYLPMLEATVSKSDYPFYAQYLLSTGKHVITCDNVGFTKISCELPFVCCINFY